MENKMKKHFYWLGPVLALTFCGCGPGPLSESTGALSVINNSAVTVYVYGDYLDNKFSVNPGGTNGSAIINYGTDVSANLYFGSCSGCQDLGALSITYQNNQVNQVTVTATTIVESYLPNTRY
jgi:hypothetical protein